jgi:hypothetical protein
MRCSGGWRRGRAKPRVKSSRSPLMTWNSMEWIAAPEIRIPARRGGRPEFSGTVEHRGCPMNSTRHPRGWVRKHLQQRVEQVGHTRNIITGAWGRVTPAGPRRIDGPWATLPTSTGADLSNTVHHRPSGVDHHGPQGTARVVLDTGNGAPGALHGFVSWSSSSGWQWSGAPRRASSQGRCRSPATQAAASLPGPLGPCCPVGAGLASDLAPELCGHHKDVQGLLLRAGGRKVIS